MTTLSGIVEMIEHGLGLVKEGLAKVPGDTAGLATLRRIVQALDEHLALNEVKVALAEVEADFSARAQAAANEWPEETTKPE